LGGKYADLSDEDAPKPYELHGKWLQRLESSGEAPNSQMDHHPKMKWQLGACGVRLERWSTRG
jgi:hypothetical protein